MPDERNRNRIVTLDNTVLFFYKKLYTEDGEVTPTMKVKRKTIAEEMYKGDE